MDANQHSHNFNVGYSYLNNNWLSGQQSFYIDQNHNNQYLVYAAYTYNPRGQLLTLINTAGNTTLSTFQSMTYDGAGNRQGMSVSIPIVHGPPGFYAAGLSGNINWTYDSQDHLTREYNRLGTLSGGTDQYAVPYTNNYVSDAAENLTTFRSVALSYNNDNQLNGLTFDGDGNPTTYPVQGSRAVTYNPEDWMTFACKRSGSSLNLIL